MTHVDTEFLKGVGIDPRSVGDPFPGPLPSPTPSEVPIPKLTEEDARWLRDLRVSWEHEPEPEFIPPKTLQEYLGPLPNRNPGSRGSGRQ